MILQKYKINVILDLVFIILRSFLLTIQLYRLILITTILKSSFSHIFQTQYY